MVAFSKIKTASIVRVKKPIAQIPSDAGDKNAALEGKDSGAAKERAGTSRTANGGVVESKEEGSTKTSLSLLDNYDSTSGSDCSD